MVSTFTTNKNIEQPGFNDYIDDWDTPVNANWALIDKAFGNSTTINTTGLSGNIALSTSQYQNLTIRLTGTPAGSLAYYVPAGVGGQWVVRNDATVTVNFYSAAGGVVVSIPSGTNLLATCDGSATGMRQSVNVPSAAAGSNTQIQFNQGGSLAGVSTLVYDGSYFWCPNLSVLGNVVLGTTAGNTVYFNSAQIYFNNNMILGSNLMVLEQTTNRVGINTAPQTGDTLTVGGVIHSTAGGIKFPDNSVLVSAASLAPGGPLTAVQFNNGGTFSGTSNLVYNSGTGFTIALNLAVSTHTQLNTCNINSLVLGAALSVASGGTGGTTGATAAASLQVLPRSVGSSFSTTGDLYIGQNSTITPGSGNNTAGGLIAQNGSMHLSNSGVYVLSLNRIAGDGDVVIFNRLGVNIGTISLTAAAVSYNATSDERVKTITGPALNLLDGLDAINVHKGYYKADAKKIDQHLVMAHELATAVPYLVTGAPGGEKMQMVNWYGAVPWLIGLIKELREEVRTLKALVA